MDEGKLHQLVGQMLNDLGGAASVAMVRMGDALGLCTEQRVRVLPPPGGSVDR